MASLGGRVSTKRFFETSDSCSLLVQGPGDFEIFVEEMADAPRRQACAAHEVGHYLLHYLDAPRPVPRTSLAYPMRISRYAGDGAVVDDPHRHLAEYEANWFMTELLMPEYLILEAARTLPASCVLSLAARLRVPPALLKARMSALENLAQINSCGNTVSAAIPA